MAQVFALLAQVPKLIAAVLVTGIGGTFQYGFQISVLNSPSSFIKELVNQTCQKRYGGPIEPWVGNLIWSFIVSIFSIGGLVGALSAGRLAAAYGRKRCLLLNNFVAIAGALLMLTSKGAVSFEMILIGRFLNGINSGVSLTVHTMYVMECAPKRLRGLVGVSVCSFVSVGKFSGQLLGLRELLGNEQRWPWLLAFSGVTGLLQLLLLPLFPESPPYLLLYREDRKGCERAVQQLWGKRDHSAQIEEMLVEGAAVRGVRARNVLELFRERAVRWQLLTVVITFITLQFCGINAVYLYSFEVFSAAGIPAHQLRYVALGTGLCELLTSLLSVMVIESTGRRVLMLKGYLGMSATLALLTVTLSLQDQVSWMPYCSMVLTFTFIGFFSSGPAAVTAPLPGEIFDQSFKPAAYTVGCSLNWFGLFFIGMVFPRIVEIMGQYCFLIFLGFCFFSGLFVWRHVPETKNRTIREVSEAFRRMRTKTSAKEQESAFDENETSKSTKF